MALHLMKPVVTRWPDNPATMIARDGIEALDLGFTQPSLNGGSMIQNKRLGGTLPPINFQPPRVNVIALNFGPKGHEARVQAPDIRISWDITLPPVPTDGGLWRSDITSISSQVANIVRHLTGKSTPFPSEWTWRIIVHPLPDANTFMDHVLFHEEQHVADHRWLAEQIIGPWAEWLTIAERKRLRFRNAKKFTLVSELTLPGSYADTHERIARYWQDTIKASGDRYHRTPAGGPPRIKVLKTVGTPRERSGTMELHLSIEPEPGHLVRASPTGLHSRFSLRKVSHPIDGNEPKLAYGVPGVRRITALNVHNAQNSSVIYIPS